jgi:hypothetical protein
VQLQRNAAKRDQTNTNTQHVPNLPLTALEHAGGQAVVPNSHKHEHFTTGFHTTSSQQPVADGKSDKNWTAGSDHKQRLFGRSCVNAAAIPPNFQHICQVTPKIDKEMPAYRF